LIADLTGAGRNEEVSIRGNWPGGPMGRGYPRGWVFKTFFEGAPFAEKGGARGTADQKKKRRKEEKIMEGPNMSSKIKVTRPIVKKKKPQVPQKKGIHSHSRP